MYPKIADSLIGTMANIPLWVSNRAIQQHSFSDSEPRATFHASGIAVIVLQ